MQILLYVSSFRRNKECPTCRKKLVSRRSLRRDSNFDALISKIYPSRDEYEAHQRRVLERLNRLHNKEALSSSIEEGLRQQARYRSERCSVHVLTLRLQRSRDSFVLFLKLNDVMKPPVYYDTFLGVLERITLLFLHQCEENFDLSASHFCQKKDSLGYFNL